MPKYDLAVVGAGLGGLAAAALAVKRNKKTILLEPGEIPGGAFGNYKKDGYLFFGRPNLSFGLERGGPLQKFSEKLDISFHSAASSPAYQTALPGRRITLYAEQGEKLEELRREFPDETQAIERFYRDLRKEAEQQAKGGFLSFLSTRKTAARFIGRYRFSSDFKAFLDLQSHFFFNRRAVDLPLVSLITMCNSTPLTLPDGFGKLAEQMANVIVKGGGEIYNIPFAEISLREGRSPRLSIRNSVIEADMILLNTGVHDHGSRLYIGVREEVLPLSMLQNVIGFTDYSHPEYFFSLSVSEKNDQTAAPQGTRTLTALFSSLSGEQTKDEGIRVIAGVIPFLSEFLLFAENHKDESRVYPVSKGIKFKVLRTLYNEMLLSRSSQRGMFKLVDGLGTPDQAITAAQAFVDRFL